MYTKTTLLRNFTQLYKQNFIKQTQYITQLHEALRQHVKHSAKSHTVLQHFTKLYNTLHKQSSQHLTKLVKIVQNHAHLQQFISIVQHCVKAYTKLYKTLQLYEPYTTSQNSRHIHKTIQHFSILYTIVNIKTTIHSCTQLYNPQYNFTSFYKSTLYNTTPNLTKLDKFLQHFKQQLQTPFNNKYEDFTQHYNTVKYKLYKHFTQLYIIHNNQYNFTQLYKLYFWTKKVYDTLQIYTNTYNIQNFTQLDKTVQDVHTTSQTSQHFLQNFTTF